MFWGHPNLGILQHRCCQAACTRHLPCRFCPRAFLQHLPHTRVPQESLQIRVYRDNTQKKSHRNQKLGVAGVAMTLCQDQQDSQGSHGAVAAAGKTWGMQVCPRLSNVGIAWRALRSPLGLGRGRDRAMVPAAPQDVPMACSFAFSLPKSKRGAHYCLLRTIRTSSRPCCHVPYYEAAAVASSWDNTIFSAPRPVQ